MHLLLFLVLFQTKQSVPNLTNPQTSAVKPQPNQVVSPNISNPSVRTTPNLTQDSPFETGYSLGKEMGTQAQNIGDIQARVGELEQKRENHDRPDINDLQKTRERIYIYWGVVWAFLATVIGILVKFKAIIWEDVLKPRLRRELIEASTATTESGKVPATH